MRLTKTTIGVPMIRLRSILGLLCALLVSTPVAAQNPWGKVPALSTSCYSDGDSFTDQLEAARAANQEASGRQERSNIGLNHQLKTIDPADMNSRMMAYMQKDPAGFRAYMQDAAGQDAQAKQAAMAAAGARVAALKKEFETLIARYSAESEAAFAPVEAEREKLPEFLSPVQMALISAKYNAAYVAVCNKWIVKGNFPAFFAKFMDSMIKDILPLEQSLGESNKRSLEMAGIDTKDFQSTEPLEAVADYLQYIRTVYVLRQRAPSKPY